MYEALVRVGPFEHHHVAQVLLLRICKEGLQVLLLVVIALGETTALGVLADHGLVLGRACRHQTLNDYVVFVDFRELVHG